MKKNIRFKKLLFIGLLLVSMGIIARVPINNEKTAMDELAAAFRVEEATNPQISEEESRRNLDDVWSEVEKIGAANAADSQTLTGTVKLYDNLDAEGIQEQQAFLFEQAGSYQHFQLENFEKVETPHAVLLIDHNEKEIVIQRTGQVDSMMEAMKLLSPDKVKELLAKDGTAASITREAGYKVLRIVPGTLDAVNEYSFYYDSVSYVLKKFVLSYTSLPYQNYQENSAGVVPSKKITVAELKASMDSTNEDEPTIEADITEYVLEFTFESKQPKTTFSFTDNELFQLVDRKFRFKGKLVGYQISNN